MPFTTEPPIAYPLLLKQFSVDFDDAWKWVGYSTKDNAMVAFGNSGFLADTDFQVFMINHKNSRGAILEKS